MKKFLLKFKILPLIISAFLFSCNDDFNPATNDGDGGNNGGEPPIIEETEYGMGWIPADPKEWEKIPLLTDPSQLGFPNLTMNKTRGVTNHIITDLPPVFNQSIYGSCVAVSIAEHTLPVVYKRATEMEYEKSGLYTINARRFSAAYLFNGVKKYYGNINEDLREGLYYPNVVHFLENKGIVTEEDYPYDNIVTKRFENINKALFNKVSVIENKNNHSSDLQAYRLDAESGNLATLIKRVIDEQGVPVVFGMHVPNNDIMPGKKIDVNSKSNPNYVYTASEYRDYIESRKTDPINFPMGGHGMTIVGYDPDKNAFKVMNSWGTNWANNGFFWFDIDIMKEDYNTQLKAIDDILVFGVKDHFKTVKPGQKSLLYDFTGYTGYTEVKYSDPTKIVSSIIDGKEYTYFKISNDDFIEYPRTTVIPEKGTIEFEIYIDRGYRYTYKAGKDKGSLLYRYTNVPIFSTLIERQSEKDNNTAPSTGGMQLRVSNNGEVTFKLAVNPFDDNVIQYSNIIPENNTIEKTIITNFKFGEWNRISLSYGDNGVLLKVNNSDEISFFKSLIARGPGNSPFTIGNSKVYHDSWTMKYYTSPVPILNYLYGTKTVYEEGFEGYLKAFRTSNTEKDWVISAN